MHAHSQILKENVDRQELRKQTKLLWDNFSKYATIKHLNDMESIVIPKVNQFEAKLNEYQRVNNQTQTILQRFDEVIHHICKP